MAASMRASGVISQEQKSPLHFAKGDGDLMLLLQGIEALQRISLKHKFERA